MPRTVTLDDVVQDQSGYSFYFANGHASCVEQYDDIGAYANDVIERYAEEVFRAILILRWLDTTRLGESLTMSDAGRVTISG